MDKMHLVYSDKLLIRVIKSQEVDLKNQKPLNPKAEGYKEAKEEREKALVFYKECLEEAKSRGIIKVEEPKPEVKAEAEKDDASK